MKWLNRLPLAASLLFFLFLLTLLLLVLFTPCSWASL